ncbi:MAG: hypothetical protein GY845_28330 [Planctomycetes bacterium]|nr:hypothetical protein [Planctomycetota bacterium]
MRYNNLSRGFGICCIIISFFIAITGAVVAVVGAFIPEATIVAIGFSAMLTAIWMLSQKKAVKKL